MTELLITTFLKSLVVHVLFSFNPMNAQNFNPTHNYAIFLVMTLNKRGIGVMNPLPNGLGSLVTWSFGNHTLSNFMTSTSHTFNADRIPHLFLEIPSTDLPYAEPAIPILSDLNFGHNPFIPHSIFKPCIPYYLYRTQNTKATQNINLSSQPHQHLTKITITLTKLLSPKAQQTKRLTIIVIVCLFVFDFDFFFK